MDIKTKTLLFDSLVQNPRGLIAEDQGSFHVNFEVFRMFLTRSEYDRLVPFIISLQNGQIIVLSEIKLFTDKYIIDWDTFLVFKAGAHLRKVLSKIPCEAVSSAVSSRVRWNFCEFNASRGHEENICRVWYFLPRKTNSSSCADVARIQLS